MTKIHPAVWDMQSSLQRGKISRREFLRQATLLGTSFMVAGSMAGCGPLAISGAEQPEAAMAIKRGGTMRIGTAVQAVDHPARLEWTQSANQLRQVAEYLTETGSDNITRPWLVERWETNEDVKMWTLHLRRDIKFNNGQDFTADDVIFNFKQWLDPAIESSMAALLSYLNPHDIERVDDYTVRLHLNQPQIGVPEHLFHYPAMIVPHTFEGDFIQQPIGTGPFTLTEYIKGERAVLKRRPDYWRLGADNKTLPYLDELIYLDLESDDRVAALQGGVIDALYEPRPVDWQALKTVPDVNILTSSTAQTSVLRMRVDQPPWDDVRVRQALKLCQDRQKLLEMSFFDQGDLGIDAHIAPIHPEYCPKPIPDYDPQQAKALLTKAGYADGLRVTLITKNDQGEDEMGRVLCELAAPAGFDIELKIVEPAKYWDQWTEVDLGLTTWTHRPLGTIALTLAYTATEDGLPVAWNETRWIDQEFTKLLRQAEHTLDIEARRKIMCQIEDIMQDRGPVGISYWRKTWNITRSEFKNIKSHPTSYDLFYDVWKDV